ncbi:LytTR family transcriptional regulator [Spirosoma sp. RP8]|uniref:LytTR family transcriptional regulator n=1 Tax=Spirosoma liriopis TaxID=2937440 RepID=A0ABT0HE53_9BACT|nr:LytTR family DNA-binding domain-containing protein [Spirosoma liriopis]MCK8490436.1 LytTR family transcriptional regulator [Spirosoma liriopis]
MSALTYPRQTGQGVSPATPDLTAIAADLIVRIEGRSNYAIVHTKDGKAHLLAKGLSVLEKQLPTFWRVHKSHLINPYYVTGSVGSVRFNALLQLTTGVSVPVSRRQRAATCARLNPFSSL